MQLKHTMLAFSTFLVIFAAITTTSNAHNITKILAQYPELSTFNHYLTVTQLAAEINGRETITVCAVDNSAMSDLLSKHLSIGSIKNVLSLHVLLDYFDSKKLHDITNGTALAATLYQATGSAPGSTGFVNITDLKGGKVGFSPKDGNGISATFVKPIDAIPYNISVIEISSILPSSDAEAPAPAPAVTNLTDLMTAHGCKAFADVLITSPAQKTFDDNVVSGLTIFCPGDDAMKKFAPKYKNLTSADQQSLLEYHAIPVYDSLANLKAGNGLTNTLATDGSNRFDFTVQNDGSDVTIVTKIVTAKIVNTLVDDNPLAIYELDKVLIPKELAKGAVSPAPAPAPEADAPAPSKKKHKSPPAPASPADSPADGPVADQTAADGNGAVRFDGVRWFGAVVLGTWLVLMEL